VRTEDKALVAGVVVSLGAHLVAASTLPEGGRPADAIRRPDPVEFVLELPAEPPPPAARPVRPPPEPAPDDPPSLEDPRPEATREPAPPAPRDPSSQAEVALVDPTTVPTQPPPAEAERAREREAARRRAALLDLSPEAAARAGMRLELPSGPRDVQSEGRRRRDDRDTSFYAERGSSLASGLSRDANRRPGGRRPPPELRRGTDGVYRWEGPLVSARIQPDGRVVFDDRPGMQMEADGQSVGGRFDITDAITRSQGQDPYAAEKRWFLRETEELRDGLSAESQERRIAGAERELRGRLRALWGNPSMPAATRRRQIFRLWDGLAEDEVGRRARAAVERFVRRALPADSADAFTTAELAELNGGRRSEARFTPYR